MTRIRVRPGAASLASGGVFRIDDASGRRRTIRNVRHAQEAVALYWRSLGATLPTLSMSDDLIRRIHAARAAARPVVQAPLPFPEGPPAAQPEHPAPRRRPTARTPQAAAPQHDLFEDVSSALDFDAVPPPGTAALADAGLPLVKPTLAELSLAELPLADGQPVSVQRVDPRALRPTDRADDYLYHVTSGSDAALALSDGLRVSASDPVMLSERQGVSYWLSVLADDDDAILDGPAAFVVLRMRRMAVEPLLEHDPHASRSAGCACFLLTGGAAT